MHLRHLLSSRSAARRRTAPGPALGALTCALAVLMGAAWSTSAAHAAGGTIEYSWVKNCNFDDETGIMVGGESIDDPLPRVGDVFYVRTLPARVGNGCGAHMSVHVEIVLPQGVELAISPTTPVRCAYDDGDGPTDFTEGCPQTSTPGMFGPSFDQVTTPEGGRAAWEMPYGRMLDLRIPLRSSRRLVGSASMLPTCNRIYGSPPCPASKAGDHVQFAIKVIDGFGAPWLAPYAPLFVQDAAAKKGDPPTDPATVTPSTTGPTKPSAAASPSASQAQAQAVIASAPSTIRVARLRRGVPIAVRVQQPGSRVSARLTLRGRTVAQATVRSARRATQTLRLRSTAGGRRTLSRLRASSSAVLHVTVTRPSGSASKAQKPLKLRP